MSKQAILEQNGFTNVTNDGTLQQVKAVKDETK